MRTADRIAHLGTETAFAVSAEAAGFAAMGNKVYPFHLGDMNIITPPNIIEAATKAMKTAAPPSRGVVCSWTFLESGLSTTFHLRAVNLNRGVRQKDRTKDRDMM